MNKARLALLFLFSVLVLTGCPGIFHKKATAPIHPYLGMLDSTHVAEIPVYATYHPGETFSVTVFFRGGVTNYPENKEGIEALALSCAAESGTSGLDPETFADRLARYGASIHAQAGPDFSTLRLDGISMYFEESWTLFSGLLHHPDPKKEVFEKLREKMAREAQERAEIPMQKLQMISRVQLFTGRQYDRLPEGTPESLRRLEFEEVRKYYLSLLRRKSFICVSAAGNFRGDSISALVNASTEKLPAGRYRELLDKRRPVPERFRSFPQEGLTYVGAAFYFRPGSGKRGLARAIAARVLDEKLRELAGRGIALDAGVIYYPLRRPYCLAWGRTDQPPQFATELIAAADSLGMLGFIRQSVTQEAAVNIRTQTLRRLESVEGQAFLAGSAALTDSLGAWSLLADLLEPIDSNEVQNAAQSFVQPVWTVIGPLEWHDPIYYPGAQ